MRRNSARKEDNMNKQYEAPKLIEVFDATESIQGGKDGLNGDAHMGPTQPATTPGYSADE
jgi:hypothetical protein